MLRSNNTQSRSLVVNLRTRTKWTGLSTSHREQPIYKPFGTKEYSDLDSFMRDMELARNSPLKEGRELIQEENVSDGRVSPRAQNTQHKPHQATIGNYKPFGNSDLNSFMRDMELARNSPLEEGRELIRAEKASDGSVSPPTPKTRHNPHQATVEDDKSEIGQRMNH